MLADAFLLKRGYPLHTTQVPEEWKTKTAARRQETTREKSVLLYEPLGLLNGWNRSSKDRRGRALFPDRLAGLANGLSFVRSFPPFFVFF